MSRHKLWTSNNNLQRQLFLKFELKKILLKSFKTNKYISTIRRYLIMFYMSNIPSRNSLSYSVFRCLVSGRVWGLNRKVGLSRFVLRNEAYNSNLPGLSRASW